MQETLTLQGYAISPQQERAWRFERSGAPLFGVHAVADVHGDLDVSRLTAAVGHVVTRHEILRTLLVHPPSLAVPVQTITTDHFPRLRTGSRRKRTEGKMHEPVEFELMWVGPNHHLLSIRLAATHADASSIRLLLDEIASSYLEVCDQPVPSQYADFADWQMQCLSGPEHAIDRGYWIHATAHADAVRFAFQRQDTSPVRTKLLVPMDAVPWQTIVQQCQQQQISPSSLLEAAWIALGWRQSRMSSYAILHDGREFARIPRLAGPLSKYLPCRFEMRPGMTARDLVRSVEVRHSELAPRVDYYGWSGETLTAGFDFIDGSSSFNAAGVCFEMREFDLELDRFPIRLSILQRASDAVAALWFDEVAFAEEDAGRIGQGFTTMLSAMASALDARLIDLPAAPASEALRELHLSRNGNEPRSHDRWLPVEELFAAQAELHPDQVAIVGPQESLRYAEVNGRANGLAHQLLQLGAGAESRVAVLLKDSSIAPVVFLAVLKAGAAYVPIDPSHPLERQRILLDSVEASIVIADHDVAIVGKRVVDLRQPTEMSSADPRVQSPAEALAYVIFTSGSSGVPKATGVTRANLAYSVRARIDRYSAYPRFVLLSPIIFDSSVAGVYGTLCSGGTLLTPSADVRQDPRKLLDFMRLGRATHTLMVPSLYDSLLSDAEFPSRKPESLMAVIVAGEACPQDLIERHRRQLPGVALHNEYGPTEATVWATAACGEDAPSIGAAIAGSQVVVVRDGFQPAPVGIPGELWIGGPGVTRGYLGKPSATAAAFVPDPWNAGARMYRTGDLAHREASGRLMFEGRADDQIKIHGQRIEPGEIECALRAVDGIGAAAVVAPHLESGSRVLAACLEARGDLDSLNVESSLRRVLPDHLVPRRYVIVSRLPRTNTGKIDRAECARLAASARGNARSGGRPPATSAEMDVASIWRELLRLESVDVTEDFFRAGGHSLLAIQLLARIRDRFDVEIRLDQLFEKPTVEGLAVLLAAAEPGRAERKCARLIPDELNRYEPFPLNSIQEAYWVGRQEGFELGNVGSTNYFEFDLPALDLDRFKRALQALIERHDMLRASIHADGYQQVAQHVPAYEIRTIDARHLSEVEVRASLDAVRAAMSSQSLATDRWPLFEIVAHVLQASVRLHISTELVICDAVSSRILLRDLYQLYQDPVTGLPPLDLRFRDYVMAERALRVGPRFERAKAYWIERLPNLAPAPELPLAKDPKQIASPHFTTLKHDLSEATWSELKRRAAAAGVTPTAVLCSAYASALSIWTSPARRFTLNLTTYNRLPVHAQVQDLAGDFTSLTMVEIECLKETFTERVRRIQHEIWKNLDHGEFGAVDIIRELRRTSQTGARAMFPVVFTSQIGTGNADDPAARRWIGDLVYSTGQAPQVWIDHQISETLGRLQFWWDYLDDLFPAGLVEQIFERYCRILEELTESDERWTSPHLDEWSDDVTIAPRNETPRLIHAGFLDRARIAPTAPAVQWIDASGLSKTMSYAEVRSWAARIAHWVQQRRDPFVAVILPKSWMVAPAVLGVTWAGSAYVPLDASWPAERIREVLQQTGCRSVIATNEYRTQFANDAGLQWLTLDPCHEDQAEPIADAVAPDALAYVIYTSGSTGIPKGVMIEHQAACVTLDEIQRRWKIAPGDKVLALSALSFDLSVFDVFGILAAGGTIVIPDDAGRRDPTAWLGLSAEFGVTIWNSVPAWMEIAMEHMEGAGQQRWPSHLRLVMLSGDWIPTSLPGRIRAKAPDAALVSLGGATEAAIWSNAHEIVEDVETIASWKSVPYGKALAGQTMQVLRGDEDQPRVRSLAPCAPWVTGRIYIGGAGLARGYWNNESETQRRFVLDSRSGERLYDTGDLGRVRPDGTIEILGRVDHQVKIRGYRVELGEIESTLLRHPEISAAAVKAVQSGGSNPYLAAYLVPRRVAGATIRPDLQHWINALQLKLDQPAYRQIEDSRVQVELESAPGHDAERAMFRARRSVRFFHSETRASVQQIGRWMECLRESTEGGSQRRQYPSAGSTYAVQTYLWAKRGGVDGLEGGLYYYDPLQHRLVQINRQIELVRELYDAVNRGVFDGAGFAIFLIGRLNAIEPLYGDVARDFCLVEAGCMTQLLMQAAVLEGVAVCPMGGLAFDRIRDGFDVDASHVLLHSLLGGIAAPPARSRKDLISSVRVFCRESLPDYLVPSRFQVVDELPLSTNGKVDRSRLPDPEERAEDAVAGEAAIPQTAAEQAIAEMWTELLRVQAVQRSDDFFALGGDSILSVRFLNRVRQRFQVELPLREFFADATLSQVASIIERLVVERVQGMDASAVQSLLSQTNR
jgi:amino acid adenylation domain-containing protein